MRDWRTAVVSPNHTVLDAMAAIDRGTIQIAIVADESARLLGVVTDGDIRAHILQGRPLDSPVTEIMKSKPVTATTTTARTDLLELMRARSIRQVPLVDGSFRIVGVATLDSLLAAKEQPNLVVLMAGGLGSRLRPLTKDVPKPMLQIGDRPILETIISQFKEYGFVNFVIAMHYLGEQIVDYFGDGGRLGVNILYMREDKPLGTAGALSLLPDRPDRQFFVMNGDILTKLNFSSLMSFHETCGSPLTMCVREHAMTVPYGVAEIQGDRLTAIVEKPVYRHLVNAGIYACNPDVIDLVPRDRPTTMVQVAQMLGAAGKPPGVFPIHEYWVDIGLHGDYQRAGAEYSTVFG